MKSRFVTMIAASLYSIGALATHPSTPPSDPTPTAVSGSASIANAGSTSVSHADASQNQTQAQASVSSVESSGNSMNTNTANGGNQSQTATGGISSATNLGNNAAQSVSFDYPKQAPSTSQGALMIGACGAGGNAGGSNSNGSAFLGIAYTPADCKLLLAAAAYQALGMPDSACEMVNGIGAVKARWKALGVAAPSCQIKAAVIVPPPVTPPVSVVVTPSQPDLSNYATKAEVETAFKRSVGK